MSELLHHDGPQNYPGDTATACSRATSPTPEFSVRDTTTAARADLVNRTHRVVRERARTMSDRRSRVKSLMIPLAICSALLIILSTAVWVLLDQYEAAPTGIPDASDQLVVFLLWFFPISAALFAVVLFRRARIHSGSESMQ